MSSRNMKICAACSQSLPMPKGKFSKKQWQLKSQRRCKECIADNREVATVEASLSCADGEGVLEEDLFKEPPPGEDCPICTLPLPLNNSETSYKPCCGKIICMGCCCAVKTADNRCLCPFCGTPAPTTSEEVIKRLKNETSRGR